jgi:competence protein ComEA
MPALPRTTLVAYALAAGIALLAVGRWAGLREGGGRTGAGAAAVLPRAPTVTTPRAARGLVVHVAGAVRRPGVYRLPAGARVRDAVRRAGGAIRSADEGAVNLAAEVADGQQVVVPRVLPAGAATSAAAGSGPGAQGPVSLNAATAEQLDALDGVGPATAAKILAWRTQHGGFASVDDLAQVPGIGPRKLEALRPQLGP